MADYFGYDVRDKLYSGEDEYFKINPNVSGMAAEDNKIIFNPYSKDVNFDSVGQNEAARLWMRENKVEPNFDLTDGQKNNFRGTAYEKNEAALKQSILARIISGDPSAGDVTPQQQQWGDWLSNSLNKRNPNEYQKYLLEHAVSGSNPGNPMDEDQWRKPLPFPQ